MKKNTREPEPELTLDVVPIQPEVLPQVYQCLVPDISNRAEQILKENLGTSGIQENLLTRIKIPAGGILSWQVPTLKGEEAVKEIQGIVVFHKDVRGFWPEKYIGANDPPQCSSDDSLTGIGDPGGECRRCPFNEFGSGTDTNGKPNNSKACGEARLLFVLRENDLIPIIVRLATMSIKPCQSFFMRLAQSQIPFYGVVIGIALRQQKKCDGFCLLAGGIPCPASVNR